MNISEICIKRPVFATVLSLTILILGVIYFFKLDIRATPDIDFPVISVEASYLGADAEYMEKVVTIPIEEELRNVKNLDKISSSSSNGVSRVTLNFKFGADTEVALNEVRSKISKISSVFPEGMKLPSVSKFDPNNFPKIWLALSSKIYNPMELTNIADDLIKKPLEKLPTVGNVWFAGARYYEVRIIPSLSKLQAYNVSAEEVINAIRSQNQDYPAGEIKTSGTEFSLNLPLAPKELQDFKKIIIKKINDKIIYLEDLAEVTFSAGDQNVIVRFNGVESIGVGLVLQSGANLLELSKEARIAIKKIQQTLPRGVEIVTCYDAATAVSGSINQVFKTIIEALILVTLVTYIFLGSLRLTLIPFVTIPISLIGSLIFLYYCNFSINTFTLLAMILAIGLVVDDAIVMLENIYRFSVEEKLQPKIAAIKGSNEIRFAIVAMTITLASVFLPIGFIEGFIGKLFIEFAWTLAFSVLVSGFVALTLTPMMSSLLIKSSATNGSEHSPSKFQNLFQSINNKYIACLKLAFNNKKTFFLICLVPFITTIYSFKLIPKEFTPSEDYSILQANFEGPEGSSIFHTDKFVRKVEEILLTYKEVEGVFTISGWGGSSSGFAFIPLKNFAEREKSQNTLKKEINKEFSAITGINAFTYEPQSMASGNEDGSAIKLYINSQLDTKSLVAQVEKFTGSMKKSGIFSNIEKNIKASMPTLEIQVNNDKSSSLNVALKDIGKSLQYIISGTDLGNFKQGSKIYPVKFQASIDVRNNINDLNRIFIKNSVGIPIALDSVVHIKEKVSLQSINHFNGLTSIKVTADLSENSNIIKAKEELDNFAAEIFDSSKVKVEYSGAIKNIDNSYIDMLMAFLFALLFIYLVLSAQFESFKDPLLIMLAVPFSIAGGVTLLYISGNSLNLYSNIGLITLIGLITKNSIMLIEFANQLREKGQVVRDAIINSASLRFRPILMTTLSTIFGGLPLIFASGPDAVARHSIGYVIVGGMLIGTCFTLFVIPILYMIFKKDAQIIQETL